MHDVALVQVIEPLEDLEDITRDQLLVQLAERLESLSERAILGVSARGCAVRQSVMGQKKGMRSRRQQHAGRSI